MPGRNICLVDGNYYHIFNRGVAKQPIFLSDSDYHQAILDLDYYRFEKPPFKLSRLKRLDIKNFSETKNNLTVTGEKWVEILSYVLMPNHWHILLKQKSKNGISKFISKFSNSYTRYFNTKHSRIGPLFQGSFKAVLIESEEQLLHLSRYIHINPVISGLISKDKILDYPWSSYPDYYTRNPKIINPRPILDILKSSQSYSDFISSHIDYAERLEIIKHQTIDLD